MDPELKKALEDLKGSLGKNVDALARVEAIEARATKGEESVKLLRSELDVVKKAVDERDAQIRAFQEEGRVVAAERNPQISRSQSLEMLGMIVRSEIARAERIEIPQAFKKEEELVRSYRSQCLARATLNAVGTTGSYLVPTLVDNTIQSAIEDVSEVLSLVDFVPGLPAAGTYNMTFLSTRPSAQPKRASVDTAMTASDPAFAQLQLSLQEMYVFFGIDNKLFNMAAMSLGGYFEGLCKEALADKLAYWLLRADGTATYNSITGLLNETTSDYIYTLPAGKTSFSDVTALDFRKAKAQNFKRGRGLNAKWLMDQDIQGYAEDIDRTGKIAIIKEKDDGSVSLLRNPIVNEDYMPDAAESAVSTAFALIGDLATVMVGMVGGIQIASDSSVRFDKNQTCFRGTTIVDIKRKPVKTLTVMKTPAQ